MTSKATKRTAQSTVIKSTTGKARAKKGEQSDAKPKKKATAKKQDPWEVNRCASGIHKSLLICTLLQRRNGINAIGIFAQ